MTVPIRVAVIEDHRGARERLIRLITSNADLAVTGDGRWGADAVDIALASQPDVLLLSLGLPGDGPIGSATATASAVRATSRISPVACRTG
jgi:two-component system nitrate/nitrite response regulator NarL